MMQLFVLLTPSILSLWFFYWLIKTLKQIRNDTEYISMTVRRIEREQDREREQNQRAG